MLKFLKTFQNLGSTILFLFLECIALFLIIRFNKGQNEIFLHSSNEIVSDLVRQKSKIEQSLDLKSQNDDLLLQNAKLIEELVNEKIRESIDSSTVIKKYEVLTASIINSSIHSLNNYFTLNKGRVDGLDKSMGVIGNKGIVGIINQVSSKYSTAISLLNINLRVSASIKDKDYSGYLTWTGEDYQLYKLNGIPKHADVLIGDEVITSGHSSIFPKGIAIGTIESYEVISGGAFYDITVRAYQDLTNTSLVYVVKNNDFEEIIELESLNEN